MSGGQGSVSEPEKTHDSMLVEKLRQVLAGEDEASAEAAIGALMQKLRHKAARKPRGGDPDQLSKLQEALATQLEETRRAEQEQVEKQREATMELLSPRISSFWAVRC